MLREVPHAAKIIHACTKLCYISFLLQIYTGLMRCLKKPKDGICTTHAELVLIYYLVVHSSLLTTAPGKAHLSPEIVFKRKFEYLVSMIW